MGEKVSNRQQTKRQNMPGLVFEKNLWDAGFNFIGGLDEAGRGAWAGPVYAAIVVLPKVFPYIVNGKVLSFPWNRALSFFSSRAVLNSRIA